MTLPGKYPPLTDLINLSGKKALVTGSARGIGYAIGQRLREAGASVVLLDINAEQGQRSRDTLAAAGGTAFFVRCDLSREDELDRAWKETLAHLGGIDILVNNAGIFPFTPLPQVSGATIDQVLAVNLKAMLLLCREFARVATPPGRSRSIINLASIDAVRPSHKGLSIYDASKGAVLSLTRSLARELGPDGVRVNALAPGGILTEGALSRNNPENTRAGLKEFMSRIPLGRMGTADDVARVALFLASDLSAYMTGELVIVDGGYLVS
jgi:2-dehydro-3-deoxy-D-gluconate 5-dehydrogenase